MRALCETAHRGRLKIDSPDEQTHVETGRVSERCQHLANTMRAPRQHHRSGPRIQKPAPRPPRPPRPLAAAVPRPAPMGAIGPRPPRPPRPACPPLRRGDAAACWPGATKVCPSSLEPACSAIEAPRTMGARQMGHSPPACPMTAGRQPRQQVAWPQPKRIWRGASSQIRQQLISPISPPPLARSPPLPPAHTAAHARTTG